MSPASPTPIRSALARVLTHDTLVLLFYCVVGSEALIYSVPLLSPGTLTAFGASPFQIPFVATAALAGIHALRGVSDQEERLFWRHLTFACIFWVATLVAIALVPVAQWRWLDDVRADAAYLLFYSPILFAAECKPHLATLGVQRDVERQLRWTGVTLLVVGWYAYFVLAPAAVEPSLLATMFPSSLLFMTIDAAIVLRFAWRSWSCGSPRWRVIYAVLALAGVSLFFTDTLDLLESLYIFALPDGAKTDLLWAIPPFFLLVAFRLREADLPSALDQATLERASSAGLDPVRVGSFLVAGALSFPIGHFVLHAAFPFTERLTRVHEFVVLADLALLCSLAVVAFRYLEHQRVAAERRRTALEERVRRARTLKAVSRVASVVADEYSALLKSIGALTDRAADILGPGDPLRDQVMRGVEQLHRAVDFTDSLRAIGRQQRGRPARLDLTEALSDHVGQLRETLGPAIALETVPAREPCVTVIDPAHLRVVLLDLATNARDAMPNGGRCRLETGLVNLDGDDALGMALQPGRYARLTVRDSGTGIPDDVMPHLFEPFFSTKRSDRRGAGLGLATMYALVSQYGGCVNVTSEPGHTAFEILLPSPQ